MLWLIAIGFVMLEAIWVFSYLYFVEYERVCDDVRDSEPMDEKPRVCAYRGRAILKPGIAPKPFVPIRYDPGDSAVPARNPRRANAKQLRRAYDRAREELKALEREARPKERKTN